MFASKSLVQQTKPRFRPACHPKSVKQSGRNLVMLFFTILLGLGSVMVMADLDIQTNIQNAWQTIMRVTITDDGTDGGNVLIDFNTGGKIFINTAILDAQTSFSGNVLGLSDNGTLIYVQASGLVAGGGGNGDGHWTGDASNIWNINTNSVGIGATPATGKLYVTSTAEAELALQEANAGNAANIHFINTTRTWTIGGDSAPDLFYIGLLGNPLLNILSNGNVGIGTTGANAKLTIDGNITSRGFIAKGTGVTANGNYSTAMGRDTTASGAAATAMGHNTNAQGMQATAMGMDTNALGTDSTAMGYGTTAAGDYSTAMGRANIASGQSATVMGEQNHAAGSFSTAMGYYTTTSGIASMVMGRESHVNGDYSSIVGGYQNNLNGNYNFIGGGYGNTIKGTSTYSSIIGGRANIISGAENSFVGGTLAYALHNYSFVRNTNISFPFQTTKEKTFIINATNGVGIRTNNPQGDLHVAGDGVVVFEPQASKGVSCIITGAVYFHTNGYLCFCDGFKWRQVANTSTECDG